MLFTSRAPIGYVAIADVRISTNQGFKNLTPYSGVSPDYLYHYLKASKPLAESYASGTTFLELSGGKFASLPLPLPPLAEQGRIVTKIEELFSKLDAGVAELKRTRALLKRYRQSVLHAAVIGELSRGWREAQGDELEDAGHLLAHILVERRARWAISGKKGKYAEPQGPEMAGLPEMPKGWVWASLEQLSWDSSYGTSIKCSYENTGQPVMRIPNVAKGVISLDDVKFAPKEAKLSLNEALASGDLLVIRTNGSKNLLGRSALVLGSMKSDTYFASYLIRFRLASSSQLHGWIASIWHSHHVRQWMGNNASSSAGQHNISMGLLNKLQLPLLSSAEQSYIVAEVERRLSILANVEATVEAELKRAESTRQGILRRAFAGQLVPQDAADEPASVLLERIQAERLVAGAAAVRATGKRGRKAKTAPQVTLLGPADA